MRHFTPLNSVAAVVGTLLTLTTANAVLAQTDDAAHSGDRGYAETGSLKSEKYDSSAMSDAGATDVTSAAARGRASANTVVTDRSEATKQKPEAFRSPEAAIDAFIQALRKDDQARLQAIFVDTHLVSSGDDVADRAERGRFLREYDRKHSFGGRDQGMVTLYVGESAWPFAVPIVQGEEGFYFNAVAGARDVLFRRIGRNELRAIAVCSGYVAAQKEYALSGHDGQPPGAFAQKLMSDAGKQNGLYWPAGASALRSPAGPQLASAEAEGYSTQAAGKSSPFHGYLFRMLPAQSAHARDGAKRYIDDQGRQMNGFALVAYPAEYGRSGVKSFIVNQDSIVYEKDLGARTGEIALAMREFDPQGWKVAP
jgi:hypothetical protein